MKRRGRKMALVAGALASALGLFVACSFPDVSYLDDTGTDGGMSADTSVGEAEASYKAPDDAAVRDDAHKRVTDAACAQDPCDCDQDDYMSEACAKDAGIDADVDCDDFDPLRHPKQDWVRTIPDESQDPRGDWNCDGEVERQYDAGVTCPGLPCAGEGFNAQPACGESSDYVQCVKSGLGGLGCSPATLLPVRYQGCR